MARVLPNQAVGKLLEGSQHADYGGGLTIPEHAIAALRPFYEVYFAEDSSAFLQI